MSEDNIDDLIKDLSDKDVDKRREAADKLGELGDPKAVEALISALNDEDQDVKINTAWALGLIGDERAVGPLIEALDDEDLFFEKQVYGPCFDTSSYAAEALMKIDGKETLLLLMRYWPEATDIVQFFILNVLYETYEVIPAREIRKNKEAIKGLLAMTSAFNEESDVDKFMEILKYLNNRRALIRPLMKDLESKDHEVRQQATTFLSNLNSLLEDTMISKAIGEMGGDEDWKIRYTAVLEQGSLGTEEATQHLIGALVDESPKVRALAAEYLTKEKAREPLKAALNDEDSSVRFSAALSLAMLGEKDVLPVVLEAIQSEDNDIRRRSVLALTKIGGDEAVKALIGALQDSNYLNRELAIRALGSLGSPVAVLPLVDAMKEALDGSDADLQILLAKTLGGLGDERALPILEAGIDDCWGDGTDEYIEEAIKEIREKNSKD